jgi:hypothetical protein
MGGPSAIETTEFGEIALMANPSAMPQRPSIIMMHMKVKYFDISGFRLTDQ